MPIFAINDHNSPQLAFVDIHEQFADREKLFLNIHVAHRCLVKILNLIVCIFHAYKCILLTLVSNIMRQQSKSKTARFHLAKGGAVPTLTHQEMITG